MYLFIILEGKSLDLFYHVDKAFCAEIDCTLPERSRDVML